MLPLASFAVSVILLVAPAAIVAVPVIFNALIATATVALLATALVEPKVEETAANIVISVSASIVKLKISLSAPEGRGFFIVTYKV